MNIPNKIAVEIIFDESKILSGNPYHRWLKKPVVVSKTDYLKSMGLEN